MRTLKITQLKPNPVGKDRARTGRVTPTQLAAEWVDFRNGGTATVSLNGVSLYHIAYAPGERNGHWKEITKFSGSLEAGKVIRVHTGQTRNVSVVASEDLVGADYHLFSGQDLYVWNNRKGDTAALWDIAPSQFIDRASYDSNPPEGVVLVRSGDKLIPRAGARLTPFFVRS